jgi:hypothetical protein
MLVTAEPVKIAEVVVKEIELSFMEKLKKLSQSNPLMNNSSIFTTSSVSG